MNKAHILLALALACAGALCLPRPRAAAYSSDASEIAREIRGLRDEVARVRVALEHRTGCRE